MWTHATPFSTEPLFGLVGVGEASPSFTPVAKHQLSKVIFMLCSSNATIIIILCTFDSPPPTSKIIYLANPSPQRPTLQFDRVTWRGCDACCSRSAVPQAPTPSACVKNPGALSFAQTGRGSALYPGHMCNAFPPNRPRSPSKPALPGLV